jgi:hypothetical protein
MSGRHGNFTKTSLLSLLALTTFLATEAAAGIISIDNLNLLPYQFSYNFPYVFSDRLPEEVSEFTVLGNAYVKVDLKIKQMGQEANGEHRLFIVMGEREYLQEIAYELDS